MKKLLALLMAAVMLMGVSYVMAETVQVEQSTAAFDVTMVIPEGFSMVEQRVNDTLCIDVLADDPAVNPNYSMTIAYSEEYEGHTISELTEEEQESLLEKLTEENFWDATVSGHTTTGGTLVFVLDENEAEVGTDYALAFTVYKGYFIQMFVEHDDYSKLSEEDIQRAIDLLSDMEFVDK